MNSTTPIRKTTAERPAATTPITDTGRRRPAAKQRDRRDASATTTPVRPTAEAAADAALDVMVPAADGTADPMPSSIEPSSDAFPEDAVAGDAVIPTEEKLAPEMKDAFLRYRSSKLAKRSSRVALALSQFMRIRLPYPRQIEAMAELDELRLLGLEMHGEQQLALTVFERTGTGKSTLARQYKMMRASEAAEGTHPVLHCRLGSSGTARDLYVSIMSELGDGFSSSGSEHSLRRRAMQKMQEADVELLIIDETQHSGNKSSFTNEINAELKIMLDTGRVPIVLLGTEEAVPIIGSDRELSGRMFSPCRLAPLDLSDDDDIELWEGFLGGLDARMVSDKIVTAPAGLSDPWLAGRLGEICDGIIGQAMRVMLMALRNTVRDARDVITIDDIADAVDEWSVAHGFASSNPVRA